MRERSSENTVSMALSLKLGVQTTFSFSTTQSTPLLPAFCGGWAGSTSPSADRWRGREVKISSSAPEASSSATA